jgi:hypothetical protein
MKIFVLVIQTLNYLTVYSSIILIFFEYSVNFTLWLNSISFCLGIIFLWPY